MEHGFYVYLASYVAHVRDAIIRLQSSSTDDCPIRVAGRVVDMFCTPMIDIANELGLPSCVFFCSNAAFLSLFLHLPSHPQQVGTTQFNKSSPDTIVPCFQNPVSCRVVPNFSFNKLGCKTFMDQSRKFKETKGILVNTFTKLEPYALKLLLSDAYQTAPVYTVGQVINLDDQIQYKPCEAAERERIMRGLVCGWVPQVEILAHKSIGAFGSHCGWNSTSESLWFGKSMVTWPLYAEQQMNAFELVRELGIAVELTLDYRLRSSNIVEASQVARAVRSVMDKGNAVRYKVKEMSELCREALMEGGCHSVV